MVRWFSPVLLLRTLALVLLARVFGAYADRREREAVSPYDGPHAYEGGEFWLDYVADLGDGWDSTTSIASLIAQPALQIEGDRLEYGRVLVMGGDEVYPAASRDEYLHRLESPYYSVRAWSEDDAPRDVYALPGNHDWYDGLAAFSRLFMQGRWFAGWRTRQSRSYFVLRLPQRWWLVAVDVQLDNDIDAAQLAYLRSATVGIVAGDKVILAAAQPWWLEDAHSPLRRNMAYLERTLVTERGARVRVALAGDQHHYLRYEGDDGTQCLTSGGGGAFLHGTAWFPARLGGENEEGILRRRSAFPGPLASRIALWRLLCFPFFNPGFALLLGTLLTLLLWVVDAGSNGIFFHNAGVDGGMQRAFVDLLGTLPVSPAVTLTLGLWLTGFVFWADAPRGLAPGVGQFVRVVAGLTHGTLHLVPAFWLLVALPPGALDGVAVFFVTLALLAAGLSLTSGLLFGAWLFLGYQLFGTHRDTAFAACRIADWKHFLRLHIRADGDLDIHVIGLRRVCRRWRWRAPSSRHEPFVEAVGPSPAQQAVRVELLRVCARE